MFKFISLLVLALFGIVGAVLLFAELESPEPPIKPERGDEPIYGNIVIKSDYAVSSLSKRIAGDCYDRDSECSALKIYGYVRDNFKVEKNTLRNEPSLSALMRERSGDNTEIAMLLVSLLEGANIGAKLDIQKDGAVAYACGIDVSKLYNVIRADMRSKILAGREITLKKNGVWAVDLKSKDGKPLTIDFSAEGAKNFDALLFPTDRDMRSYLADKSGRYAPECALFGVIKAELSCITPSGGKLAFISREDGNVLKGQVSRGGFLINDIKTKDFGGISCVAMDMEY